MASVGPELTYEQAAAIVASRVEAVGKTVVYSSAFQRELAADADRTQDLLRFATLLYGETPNDSRQVFLDSQVHRFAVQHVLADFRAWHSETEPSTLLGQ